MNAYCPECETELDQSTGICPACRWDPLLSAGPTRTPVTPQMSLTERYRGTEYDASIQMAAETSSGLSRGRTFLIVTLLAMAALYAAVFAVLGLL
jgi:hypothetical protein